jgi:MFS family permease
VVQFAVLLVHAHASAVLKSSPLIADANRQGKHLGAAYKGYVLAVMTGVTTLNYLDRVFLALVLQPVKVDLRLSDTQLGFLTGIAFAVFYSTFGIPISRWADRRNRVTLTALAIGLWGMTVMACLFVTNFAQLLLARIAAAVGESGCVPPTYSLAGDYFPKPGERARALAIYTAANPLSVLIGCIAGGWLNERYGWRVSFFLIGIPGLLMAILVKATIAETPNRLAAMRGLTNDNRRFAHVLKELWHQHSVRRLALGYICFATLGLGLTPWYAAFLARSHDMSTAEVGLWFGLLVGINGVVGMVLGGYVAGRWLDRDEPRQLRLMALMSVLLMPSFALFLLLPQKHEALLALIPMVLVFNCFSGPLFALMQRLVRENIRATSLAIVLLLSNLIGLGLGPQIVGILSDILEPSVGTDSLRYAMLSMTAAALCAAYFFWMASRTVKNDLHTCRLNRRHSLATVP